MLTPGVPFTRRQALASGVAPHALRTKEYRRLFRGCYVDALADLTHELYVAGALTVVPSAEFVAGRSAARLLGGVVPSAPYVQLGSTRTTASRTEGIRLRRYATSPPLVRVGRRLCTSPVQTFLDVAPDLPLVDQVVLGDSLVRRKRVTPQQLVEAAASARGRGAVGARAAAQLVRAGVDSPRESRLRMLVVLAGLPEPTVNLQLVHPNGRLSRRFELAYPDAKLAMEYDGRHHIEREEQWANDLMRREELEGLGWRFFVVISGRLRRPSALLAELTAAMRERGMRVPKLSDDWRRHFPEY